MTVSRDKHICSHIHGVMGIIEWCHDIVDGEYQERVWIRQEGTEVDSFYDCSVELSDTIEGLLATMMEGEFSAQQIYKLMRFSVYLDKVDVEREDGLSRGGCKDKAPEWLQLKSEACSLISVLAPFLLTTVVQDYVQRHPDSININSWKRIIKSPLSGYTEKQREALLNLKPSFDHTC